MQRLGKRKNASNRAHPVCSPKKQVRAKQEIIPKCTIDIGRDETSSSDENDSGVADELFKKLRKNRNESGSEENEGLHSGDSDDSDDDVDSDDDTVHKILDDSEEEEESDDDDNDDDEDNSIGHTDERNDDNKMTVSAKIKLSKGNKNLKEIGGLPGNEKDKNMLDSSEEEGSGDSSTDEEDSSDDQEEYTKINTRDKSTSNLKGTLVKQEPGKTKPNEVESSDNSSSDDSSVNDDDDDAEYNNEVKQVNEKLQTAGKSFPVKGKGINSDEYSDESDDESNRIMKRESNSDSKVFQIGNKQPSDKEGKQDVQDNIKESSSDSDSSDSSDDGSNDVNTNHEEAENDESEDEFAAVKKELADIPLEDLMKIKDKLGLKTFNKIMHGDKFEEKKQKVFKRENKNRPMEVSAKKRVPVIRNAMVPKEKVRRDPRFDDLSGEFQDKHFMKNYAFLDDVKQKEKLLVQKKMKQTKDEEKKKELSKLLNRMNQQEQLEQKKRHRIELEQQWKQKEKQLVKEGKTPYFLKKSDKKKLELAEKFKELQKSGKVDQYMSKKMKRNAQKEKKKLPGRHERFQ